MKETTVPRGLRNPDQISKAIEEAKKAAFEQLPEISRNLMTHRMSCPQCSKATTVSGMCGAGKKFWEHTMGRPPSTVLIR